MHCAVHYILTYVLGTGIVHIFAKLSAVFALQFHFRCVIRGNFFSDIVLGGIELPWRLRHRKLLQMSNPALHAFRERMDTSLIDIVGSFLTRHVGENTPAV